MQKIIITKADGRQVQFNPNKIISTCRRAGASKETTRRVIKKIKGQIFRGIATRDIYKMVLQALDEEKGGRPLKYRYQLKDAIMRLGPSGYMFENFVSEILKYSEFQIKNIRTKVKGMCANHEIDIIALHENKKFLIECKYHAHHGKYVGLKESLYTHARFIDTKPFFDAEGIVCNTKVSGEAKKYSKCIGQELVSWRYPPQNSLEQQIERNNLYPITILNLNKNELNSLSKNNIILAKDLLDYSEYNLSQKTGIKIKRIQNFQKLIRQIIR